MPRSLILPFLALLIAGAGWGLTQPLAKIAVSEGYRQFGLVFWQMTIGALALGTLQAVRRRRVRRDSAALVVYLQIALVGTVIPNSASYEAIRHLPSGLVSVLLSFVPMFAFPIALAFRIERFVLTRLLGLCLGLAGVLLIVGPEASLPERAMVAFVPIALIAPFFYGLESNLIAKWGTAGLDPVDALLGALILGSAITFPLAQATGQFIDPRPPWALPDMALLAASLVHVMAYCLYVWMVGRAGALFAVQVSYLVTGFGVFWAMLLLGEIYSVWIWAAICLMLLGVFLVQPGPGAGALAGEPESGEK
ncbi:MAG: DMT family transporter [Boseongicola sp. SB0664_bin_43]|uniref:DMT family transporter n=1 Tax=Boseongicola sp. SB0664_bin_43 TaxID=2604844 RepID=A0A6B0Y1G0_9RHOB|nr:DMT family transporter [Boseongicola sp. SB0664_bin_43]